MTKNLLDVSVKSKMFVLSQTQGASLNVMVTKNA